MIADLNAQIAGGVEARNAAHSRYVPHCEKLYATE
jgi:hypothetical protein